MNRDEAKTLLRSIALGRPYVSRLAGVVGLNLAHAGMDVVFLLLLKGLIDRGFSGAGDWDVRWLAVGALVVVMVRSIIGYTAGWLSSWVEARLLCDVQNRIYSTLHSRYPDPVSTRSTGDLLALLFYHARETVHLVTSPSGLLSRDLFRIPFLAAFLFSQHAGLATLAVALLVPSVFLARAYSGRIGRATEKVHESMAEMYTTAEETLSHAETVAALGRHEMESARFKRMNDRMADRTMGAYRALATSGPVTQSARMAGLVILVFAGARTMESGGLSAGGLATFTGAAWYLYGGVYGVLSWLLSLYGGMVSARLVFETWEGTPVRSVSTGDQRPSLFRELALDNVTFGYAGANRHVLSDLSLEIRVGETLLLAGRSGSGKTTILRLLLRLLEPLRGRVMMDGRDVRGLDMAAYRALFGFAGQEPAIFQATPAEVIRYGRPDATMDDIIQAARTAGADEFIRDLPEGYDTPVGERGDNFSAGQRQRLALARALVREPDVLLLDEALGHVDAESEADILARVVEQRKRRTTIVVSHRRDAALPADRVVLIADGGIVASGAHRTLLDENTEYQDWWHAGIPGAFIVPGKTTGNS
ncbi:MAG: ABC transporter ATP-binding protein [Desulfatibacillaceae bacterium]